MEALVHPVELTWLAMHHEFQKVTKAGLLQVLEIEILAVGVQQGYFDAGQRQVVHTATVKTCENKQG